MATEFIKLKGKVAWNKVIPHKPDRYANQKFWSIDLYLDEENLKKKEDAGIQLKPRAKPDLEEGVGFRFRRKTNESWGPQDPPVVVDVNGDPLRELIGWGSTVELTVEVYDTVMGKGNRFSEVKVLDLVPVPAKEEVPSGVKTNTSPQVKMPW